MNVIEKIEYKKHDIGIYYDEDTESPRTMFDNICEFHCSHKRYSLGDKNYKSGEECLKEVEEREKDGDIVLPLYIYDHSGITISLSPFSCPWDSGQVGFVIIPRKKMLKEFGKNKFTKKLKEKALEIARAEVEDLDKYLTGSIYVFRIEKDEELIDSCGGIYGIEEAISSAKEYIDTYKV